MLKFVGDSAYPGRMFVGLPDGGDVVADIFEISGDLARRQQGILHVDESPDDILLAAQDGAAGWFGGVSRKYRLEFQIGKHGTNLGERDTHVAEFEEGVFEAARLTVFAFAEIGAPAPYPVYQFGAVDRLEVG